MSALDTKTDNKTPSPMHGAGISVGSPEVGPRVQAEISEIIKQSERTPNVSPDSEKKPNEAQDNQATFRDNTGKLGVRVQINPPINIPVLPDHRETLQKIKTSSKEDSPHWQAVLIEKVRKWLGFRKGK